MDYIAGAISLVGLVLNYLIYKRILATCIIGSAEELEPTTSHCCCEVITELLNPVLDQDEAHDPPLVTIPMVEEVYSAWKNQKEIPWVPPIKTPEPINKPPNRGPLARPDGFI